MVNPNDPNAPPIPDVLASAVGQSPMPPMLPAATPQSPTLLSPTPAPAATPAGGNTSAPATPTEDNTPGPNSITLPPRTAENEAFPSNETGQQPSMLSKIGRFAATLAGGPQLANPNATPEQKAQGVLGILSRVGNVGAAAFGSPQQRQLAVERQGQANQLQALQNEQQYRQGMLANTEAKNAETVAKDQATAEAKHQDQTRKNLMLNQVEDPNNPGVYHPATPEQTLANPYLAQNQNLRQAAIAAKQADTDLAAAKTDVSKNQNTQFMAALQQKRDQAYATLQMANAHLHDTEMMNQNTMFNQGQQRQEKSYDFNTGQIMKLRQPIDQRVTRVTNLMDSLNQNSPQADSLIAPELLTTMAGGQGSGLRMNEAEISRIVGGRDQWETLKAKVNAWQLDPTKPFALTPAQRLQVRSLMQVIQQRLADKQAVADGATYALADPAATPDDHRRIVANTMHDLDAIDSRTETNLGQGTPDVARPLPQKQSATPAAGPSPQLQAITLPASLGGGHPVDYAVNNGVAIVKTKAGGPWVYLATGKPVTP